MPTLDMDVLNARWYCAVRDGLVVVHAEDQSAWALTDCGWEVACQQAYMQGLRPDDLSEGQLISLAVYGTTDMG